jgi:hypothetical protein
MRFINFALKAKFKEYNFVIKIQDRQNVRLIRNKLDYSQNAIKT